MKGTSGLCFSWSSYRSGCTLDHRVFRKFILSGPRSKSLMMLRFVEMGNLCMEVYDKNSLLVDYSAQGLQNARSLRT